MKKNATAKRTTPHLHHPAFRERDERPWRDVLQSMSREELMDLTICAAWQIKALEEDVDRLWSTVQKNEEARRKAPAAREAKSEKAAVKAEIKRTWLERRRAKDPSVWKGFAREMWDQYRIIGELRSIQRWVREWEAELHQPRSAQASPSDDGLRARWQALPEIFRLAHYFPKGFFGSCG